MTVAFVLMLSFWSGQRLLDDGGRNPTLMLAAALFILAALTDALDGFLARRWNVVSRFGRIMDPFADKVLVLGAFIVLASPAFASPLLPDRQMSGVDAWMVVLILGRELLVTSIRAVFEGEGIDFSAGLSGKIKMVLQAIAVPLILIVLAEGVPSPGSRRQWIIDITVWSTIIITVISGIPYVSRAIALEFGADEP